MRQVSQGDTRWHQVQHSLCAIGWHSVALVATWWHQVALGGTRCEIYIERAREENRKKRRKKIRRIKRN